MDDPVIRNCAFCLVHAPDLVRYGSKPRRELGTNPSLAGRLEGALRSYAAAVAYPPNQTFIGNLSPQQLGQIPNPGLLGKSRTAREPRDPSEKSFTDLLHPETRQRAAATVGGFDDRSRSKTGKAVGRASRVCSSSAGTVSTDSADFQQEIATGKALPLETGGALQGLVRGDNRSEGAGDTNLDAHPCCWRPSPAETTGAQALMWLLHREEMQPDRGLHHQLSQGSRRGSLSAGRRWGSQSHWRNVRVRSALPAWM